MREGGREKAYRNVRGKRERGGKVMYEREPVKERVRGDVGGEVSRCICGRVVRCKGRWRCTGWRALRVGDVNGILIHHASLGKQG